MVDSAQPSRNPANSGGDMSGAFREILGKFLQSVDDMIPAKIIAYDRETNRATIQPLIALVRTDGVPVSRNQLASIPVFNIGGGGYILSFNLKEGDLGWIKAADRDIAEFLKNYTEATPATRRVHDFNNGIFIPDVMTGYQIDPEDEENAVLQSLDGVVRVALFPDKLKLTAPVVEVAGQALLGGPSGIPIARLGDDVEVTITSGSSAGTWSGTITSASAIHKAT